MHKWPAAVPSLKDQAIACPEVSPNVLDDVLPGIGGRKTTDDTANERRETADEPACSPLIPQQDPSQKTLILVGIVIERIRHECLKLLVHEKVVV
jgi:hypothetical protein